MLSVSEKVEGKIERVFHYTHGPTAKAVAPRAPRHFIWKGLVFSLAYLPIIDAISKP